MSSVWHFSLGSMPVTDPVQLEQLPMANAAHANLLQTIVHSKLMQLSLAARPEEHVAVGIRPHEPDVGVEHDHGGPPDL
jgi:hypothetical protein